MGKCASPAKFNSPSSTDRDETKWADNDFLSLPVGKKASKRKSEKSMIAGVEAERKQTVWSWNHVGPDFESYSQQRVWKISPRDEWWVSVTLHSNPTVLHILSLEGPKTCRANFSLEAYSLIPHERHGRHEDRADEPAIPSFRVPSRIDHQKRASRSCCFLSRKIFGCSFNDLCSL